MTPIAFLRRLAFLVPPPFYPLLRYHGVFAPNSTWRSRVVRVNTGIMASQRQLARCAEPISPMPPPQSDIKLILATTLLAATTSRLSRFEWATLLKRIYDVDALNCPRCDGRLEFISVITDPITTCDPA
ncbi:MAG: transposase [Deltaproteobacteria bacterium]|nr:transposase [Deltaproteobacteria bacterium]